MKVRPVDENDDMMPIYSLDQLITGPAAVAQVVKANLTLPEGEWWEDTSLGIDIPGFILDNARLKDVEMLKWYLNSYILGIEGVDALQDVDVITVEKQMRYRATLISEGEEEEMEVSLDGLLDTVY